MASGIAGNQLTDRTLWANSNDESRRGHSAKGPAADRSGETGHRFAWELGRHGGPNSGWPKKSSIFSNKPRADGMLQLLGILVDFIPWHAENFGQESTRSGGGGGESPSANC